MRKKIHGLSIVAFQQSNNNYDKNVTSEILFPKHRCNTKFLSSSSVSTLFFIFGDTNVLSEIRKYT